MQMVGNIVTMAERVDDEFTKLLQNTDAHSTDYVTKYACYVCKVPEVSYKLTLVQVQEGYWGQGKPDRAPSGVNVQTGCAMLVCTWPGGCGQPSAVSVHSRQAMEALRKGLQLFARRQQGSGHIDSAVLAVTPLLAPFASLCREICIFVEELHLTCG